MMKNLRILLCLLCFMFAGCTTVKPNQSWPILPEYPRPEVPKISKVELLEAIDALPPGEEREKIKLLTNKLVDELVEAWRDFAFWGDRMNAAIQKYNEEAKDHNKKVQ